MSLSGHILRSGIPLDSRVGGGDYKEKRKQDRKPELVTIVISGSYLLVLRNPRNVVDFTS